MRANVIWAYVAQFFNVAGGLLLLPLIIHYLPSEEVGAWFVFVALAGVAQLLELGFQPTISRNVTYAYNGAVTLMPDSVPDVSADGKLNSALLANLVNSSRKIYMMVGMAVALVLLIGGTAYIATLPGADGHWSEILPAWLAFAGGQVATFYFNYYNSALFGRGNIAEANKIIVLTRASFVLIAAVLLVLKWGLVGLGVASLAASILGRILAGYYFRKFITPDIAQEKNTASNRGLIRVLWHNASRFGIVQVGAFLILRANLLIASSFLGLKEAASYGLALTLVFALNGLSGVIGQVQLPKMNALQAKGDIQGLQAIFGSVLISSWTLYVFGLGVLLLVGPWALHAVGSSTELLPTSQLLLLGIILLLELNHSLAATYLTTTNRIQFVHAAIWSGAAIVILSAMLAEYAGIWALLLVQGVVQLSYNNWKWPQLALRHLNCSVIEIIQRGFHELGRKRRHAI